MDNLTQKALKALRRLQIFLQVIGIYIKPHHKLKLVHVCYCVVFALWTWMTIGRLLFATCTNISPRRAIKMIWLLAMIKVGLVPLALNIGYKKSLVVFQNCADLLSSATLQTKTKRTIILITNIVLGSVIIASVFLLITNGIETATGLMGDDAVDFLLHPLIISQTNPATNRLYFIY